MIGLIAAAAGFIAAFPVVLATGFVDMVEMPRSADWMNRAVKPTALVFLGISTLHYIVEGFDWGAMAVALYGVAISIHLCRMPAIERVPLGLNPRGRYEVLSQSTSRWLYVLALPSVCVPVLVAAVSAAP